MQIALLSGGAIVAIAGGGWLWHTEELDRWAWGARSTFLSASAKAGFTVENVFLSGRKSTSMSAINKVLGIRHGDPMLTVGVSEIRERLESLPRVKTARVERILPDTLHIQIVERQPAAIWQNKGKQQLVDNEGVVIADEQASKHPELLLIVGDDAPKHADEILKMLATVPDLREKVQSAIWVSGRRWNIRLKGGVEVRLPEEDPAGAWKRLARIESHQQILQRSIKAIDLRIGDRMFIETSPDKPKPLPGAPTAGASET